MGNCYSDEKESTTSASPRCSKRSDRNLGDSNNNNNENRPNSSVQQQQQQQQDGQQVEGQLERRSSSRRVYRKGDYRRLLEELEAVASPGVSSSSIATTLESPSLSLSLSTSQREGEPHQQHHHHHHAARHPTAPASTTGNNNNYRRRGTPTPQRKTPVVTTSPAIEKEILQQFTTLRSPSSVTSPSTSDSDDSGSPFFLCPSLPLTQGGNGRRSADDGSPCSQLGTGTKRVSWRQPLQQQPQQHSPWGEEVPEEEKGGGGEDELQAIMRCARGEENANEDLTNTSPSSSSSSTAAFPTSPKDKREKHKIAGNPLQPGGFGDSESDSELDDGDNDPTHDDSDIHHDAPTSGHVHFPPALQQQQEGATEAAASSTSPTTIVIRHDDWTAVLAQGQQQQHQQEHGDVSGVQNELAGTRSYFAQLCDGDRAWDAMNQCHQHQHQQQQQQQHAEGTFLRFVPASSKKSGPLEEEEGNKNNNNFQRPDEGREKDGQWWDDCDYDVTFGDNNQQHQHHQACTEDERVALEIFLLRREYRIKEQQLRDEEEARIQHIRDHLDPQNGDIGMLDLVGNIGGTEEMKKYGEQREENEGEEGDTKQGGAQQQQQEQPAYYAPTTTVPFLSATPVFLYACASRNSSASTDEGGIFSRLSPTQQSTTSFVSPTSRHSSRTSSLQMFVVEPSTTTTTTIAEARREEDPKKKQKHNVPPHPAFGDFPQTVV